jgi:hypothetical protein
LTLCEKVETPSKCSCSWDILKKVFPKREHSKAVELLKAHFEKDQLKFDEILSKNGIEFANSFITLHNTRKEHAYPHSSAVFVCDLTTDMEVADGTRQG